MSIGIVSNEDLEAELARLNKSPVVQGEIVDKPHRGRSDGDTNVPDSLRKIIGETSVIDGRAEALALAEMFDVSKSSVSAYAKGSTSTASYQSPSKSILAHINKARARASKKAGKVLASALDSITPEKLENLSARNLAGVAKDMSAVIKNLEPPPEVVANEADSNKPQFVIFAPQFRKEEHFETIVVNE